MQACLVQVKVWRDDIQRALLSGILTAGEASQMAGRLSFTSQYVFKRLGRAMLVPIFRQARRPRYMHYRVGMNVRKMDSELRLALAWWLDVLNRGTCEVRTWKEHKQAPIQLLCDARSTPPRVAAVCICDGIIQYADTQPKDEILEQFKVRDDGQIASLEMLAIALGEQVGVTLHTRISLGVSSVSSGLSTFRKKLQGRNVVVHTDNTIAEHSIRKGRARSFDHACVVHSIW